MLTLNGLSQVDCAATYLREAANPFVRRRLEQVLDGETVSGLFQKRIGAIVGSSPPEVLEQRIDDYLPTFIKDVLLPFVSICGFQLKTSPDADLSVYTVFGQWWAASGEMQSTEKGDASASSTSIPYTFSEAMKLVRGGLDYHPTSIELYMTIAHNYYQEMEAASAREEWSRVLTYAQVGDHHLQKALQLNPRFEPRSVSKLRELRDQKVGLAEERLREIGL